MRLIDGVEGEILKKYRKGRVIDEKIDIILKGCGIQNLWAVDMIRN